MNEEHKNELKDRLLRDIRTGSLTMTPRLYFTLKVAATILVAIAILVVSIFIVNFIAFSIRIGHHAALLGFGTRGLFAFLALFPWNLLAIDVGLVILLQYLLRQFKFGYRIPSIYLASGLVAGAIVLGVLLDTATPLNDRILVRSHTMPPPIGRLYEGARRPPPPGSGICRCAIIGIEGNTLIVEDTRDATTSLTVILPEDDFRATTTGLSVGDIVFIAGEEEDGVIRAFGVRKDDRDGEHMRFMIIRGE